MAELVKYGNTQVAIPRSQQEVDALAPNLVEPLKQKLVALIKAEPVDAVSLGSITIGSGSTTPYNTQSTNPYQNELGLGFSALNNYDHTQAKKILAGMNGAYSPIVRMAADGLAWVNTRLQRDKETARTTQITKDEDLTKEAVKDSSEYYYRQLVNAAIVDDLPTVTTLLEKAKAANLMGKIEKYDNAKVRGVRRIEKDLEGHI